MFQAMGNTVPSLFTSSARIVIFAIPAFLLSRAPGFQLRWIWYLSVGAVLVQLALTMLLLRREFGLRLRFESPVVQEMAS
jgi:Na+-driven multidrug efflux pump